MWASKTKRNITTVIVFEYTLLCRAGTNTSSAQDTLVSISSAAYDYLRKLCLCDESESRFLRLKSWRGREVLQVQNYAGVVRCPDGTDIEILPKVAKPSSNSTDASNVFLGAMGAYKGMGFQSRAAPGETTVHHGIHWVNSNKAWVKLIKIGSEIEALYRVSTDDEWTSLGVKSIDFGGATKLRVGYAVTVGNEDNSWNYADLYIKNYSIQ